MPKTDHKKTIKNLRKDYKTSTSDEEKEQMKIAGDAHNRLIELAGGASQCPAGGTIPGPE